MSSSAPLRGRAPYALLATAVVALDQLAKFLVDRFMDLHESWPIVQGLVSLTYVRNRGAAFGLFSESDLPYQAALFSAVSVFALVAIATYALRLPPAHRLTQCSLALVMGGAFGNLLDRSLLGYVIDFVDVYWKHHHWPAFNVADSAITVGVCLLVLDILRSPGESRKPEMLPAGSAGRAE